MWNSSSGRGISVTGGLLLAAIGLSSLVKAHEPRGASHAPRISTSRNYLPDEVNDQALADKSNSHGWLAYGRTYDAQRFSPLDQVNAGNVGTLGVAWYTDLPANVGLVSTPLVTNGTVYFTDSRNIVRSVDARSGKILWTYDPKVDEAAGDAMDFAFLHGGRGIAMWEGKIFLASVDGRMIALDASTGRELWSTRSYPLGEDRFVTAAPFAFRGKVIISDAGGENGKERGVVTAFDAETGKIAWKFYTVPGDPTKGFEDDAQARAAKTWTGEWWKQGGGGSVFSEAYAYDPELNLLFIGTGGGVPPTYHMRSPGGGDNLYLSSIVALDADTGKYRWHYQATPHDSWDFDNSSPIILADLKIKGRTVKALMQAPKNGFFYVLDRRTGKLVSAEPYAKVTWASKIDLKTGRPVFNPEADFELTKHAVVWPGTWGAHDWQPPSYNPVTGLVYFPKREAADTFLDNDPEEVQKFLTEDRSGFHVRYPRYRRIVDSSPPTTSLIAWDPIRQRKQWEVVLASPWSPGTLSTAGNLVFEGDVEGHLNAFDARSGTKLWSYNVGVGVTAPPITYSLDGRQYVSVLVGFGGGFSGPAGESAAKLGWAYGRHTRRLVTFSLGETTQLPSLPSPQRAIPIEADFKVDPALAKIGARQFRRCSLCHGFGAIGGGLAPDLRASPIVPVTVAFDSVVRGGARRPLRMPSFKLTDAELTALQHYIRQQAGLALTQGKDAH